MIVPRLQHRLNDNLSAIPALTITLWTLAQTARALAPPIPFAPEPTPPGAFGWMLEDRLQFEPLPTTKPKHELLLRQWKRLQVGSSAGAAGNSAVCGWIDGDPNNPVSCSSGYSCAYTGAYVGCCTGGPSTCAGIVTACYDYGSEACDASCSAKAGVLMCQSSPSQRFCATYLYPGGSTGYGCGAINGFTTSVWTSTKTGLQASPFTLTTATITTSSTSTTPTAPASTNPNTRVGIIAGATLGGIAFLATLSALLWFLIHRYRKIRRDDDSKADIAELPTIEPGKDSLAFAPYSPSQSPPNQSTGGYPNPHMSPNLGEGSRPLSPVLAEHQGYVNGMPFSAEHVMHDPRYTGPRLPEVEGSVPQR